MLLITIIVYYIIFIYGTKPPFWQMQQSQFPAALDRAVPYPIAGYRRKRSAVPEDQVPAPHSNSPLSISEAKVRGATI
jgi:hypothetical protein